MVHESKQGGIEWSEINKVLSYRFVSFRIVSHCIAPYRTVSDCIALIPRTWKWMEEGIRPLTYNTTARSMLWRQISCLARDPGSGLRSITVWNGVQAGFVGGSGPRRCGLDQSSQQRAQVAWRWQKGWGTDLPAERVVRAAKGLECLRRLGFLLFVAGNQYMTLTILCWPTWREIRTVITVHTTLHAPHNTPYMTLRCDTSLTDWLTDRMNDSCCRWMDNQAPDPT